MNTFLLLLSCIFLFSILTFIVLFGHIPGLKHTPIGWANTLLTVFLPNVLAQVDQAAFAGFCTDYIRRKRQRLTSERHPVVLIMYLFLFSSSVYIFLTRMWVESSRIHKTAIPVLIALPLLTLYLAAGTEPGYITSQNHAHYMAKYSYDGVLFRPGHECTTCLREKPARSKHCPLCNKCIAKHDHHCIWINSCVGEHNMKWFLAFLLTNSITFTYASVVLYLHFSHARTQYVASFQPSSFVLSGLPLWLSLLKKDALLGGLFLFVVLCDAMVSAFFLYHSYLIFSGVTTNETLKFDDIREAIRAGEVDLYHSNAGNFHLDLAGQPGVVQWSALENVYDEGWKTNLSRILYET